MGFDEIIGGKNIAGDRGSRTKAWGNPTPRRGRVGGGGHGDRQGKPSETTGGPASLSLLLAHTRSPHASTTPTICTQVSEPRRGNYISAEIELLCSLKHFLLNPTVSQAVSQCGGCKDCRPCPGSSPRGGESQQVREVQCDN